MRSTIKEAASLIIRGVKTSTGKSIKQGDALNIAAEIAGLRSWNHTSKEISAQARTSPDFENCYVAIGEDAKNVLTVPHAQSFSECVDSWENQRDPQELLAVWKLKELKATVSDLQGFVNLCGEERAMNAWVSLLGGGKNASLVGMYDEDPSEQFDLADEDAHRLGLGGYLYPLTAALSMLRTALDKASASLTNSVSGQCGAKETNKAAAGVFCEKIDGVVYERVCHLDLASREVLGISQANDERPEGYSQYACWIVMNGQKFFVVQNTGDDLADETEAMFFYANHNQMIDAIEDRLVQLAYSKSITVNSHEVYSRPSVDDLGEMLAEARDELEESIGSDADPELSHDALSNALLDIPSLWFIDKTDYASNKGAEFSVSAMGFLFAQKSSDGFEIVDGQKKMSCKFS